MRIFTENSLYVWDTDEGTILRTNVTGEDLRRDGDPIPVVGVYLVAVGVPAAFLLDLRGDGILTLRETSPVVSVEP